MIFDQGNLIRVINIVCIGSFLIIVIPLLIIAIRYILILLYKYKSKEDEVRKRDDEVNKKKKISILHIVMFALGSLFLAVSIESPRIMLLITPLIGIKNIDAIPERMISIVALIISLFFLFVSLYNFPIIRNMFVSHNIEQKYLAFKDETLEKLHKLLAELEHYKSEATAINDINTTTINDLKTYTYEQIQEINNKMMEKIHQFELANVENLYQCKLELSVRLDHMQNEIDGIQKKVEDVDHIIDKLENMKP